MYVDKIDGRISQELFDRQAASMRGEQDGLVRKIQASRMPRQRPSIKQSICFD